MAMIKYICLAVLVWQTVINSSLVRNSRNLGYSTTIVVICQEVLKLVTCTVIILVSEGFGAGVRSIHYHVISQWKTTLKVGVPAFLYVVQNQLLFVALSNLDAATFQITYQLKILTTSIFSVILLNKVISRTQWCALVVLTAGVVLAQWKPPSASQSSHESSLVGVLAIVVASMTSGLAGVFFEMMLKDSRSSASLWIKNTQLAVCSCFVGIVNIILTERDHISEKGMFYDFEKIVICIIISQAYGGLLIGLVVKYADNIMKVFATSISIVVSSLIGIFYFKEIEFTLAFGGGLVLVLTATAMFSLYPAKKKED